MKQVLVIVGPTGVGKTDFSIEVAKRFNGEIISGDSIQIYKGFDIGSGKIREEEKEGIPHYLIDELDAKTDYSVADFQERARACIDEISSRGKLPIICGGTGLYIKACLYDYHFIQDEQNHEDPYPDLSNEEVHELLKQKDAKSAEKIHPNNRRRVLRALQLADKEMTKSENEDSQSHEMIYDALVIGCTAERSFLYERINRRVRMMAKDGLEDEIKGLLASGVTFEDHPMSGIGYKEWKPYIEGIASVEDVIGAIQTHSRQFAKRQYTWFNHQIPTTWINRFEDVNAGFDVIEQWRK